MGSEWEKDCRQHVLKYKMPFEFVLFNIIHEKGIKLTFFFSIIFISLEIKYISSGLVLQDLICEYEDKQNM